MNSLSMLVCAFFLLASPVVAAQPVASAVGAAPIQVQLDRDGILHGISQQTQTVLIQPIGEARSEPAIQALSDLLLEHGLELARAAPLGISPDPVTVRRRLAAHHSQLLITVEVSTAVVFFTMFDSEGRRSGTAKAEVTGIRHAAEPTRLDGLREGLPMPSQALIAPSGDYMFLQGVQYSLDGPQLYEALSRRDLAQDYRGRRALGRGLMVGGGVAMVMGMAVAPMALIADTTSPQNDAIAVPVVAFIGGAAAFLTGLILPNDPLSSAERDLLIARHNEMARAAR